MFRYAVSVFVFLITASAAFYFGSGYFSFPEEKSPTEIASPLPDTIANVLAPTDVLSPEEIAAARPWVAPSYEDQSLALGWSATAFAVPPGLRARVDFWKEIYSKYSTDEGVLHDPVTLDVYESIWFPPYHAGDSLSAMGRERSRIVESHRALISERLLSLQMRLDNARAGALTTPFDGPGDLSANPRTLAQPTVEGTPSSLTSVAGLFDVSRRPSREDLRLQKFFERDSDPQKYARAAARIRFQLGQRDRILHGIYDSGRYLAQMEKIFRDERLPIELTRLPFVESSFNTQARSKVGASGIWQFMRRTARPYLKMNSSVDERNDPLIATRAAARMMKSNFQLLRNWPLAVTAWNHGPSGVRNITLKLATDDLAKIVSTYSSRTFGFASQNFYACFLAMLEVEGNARAYFTKPVWQASLAFDEVKTPGHLTNWPTVLKLFGGSESLALDYNPQLNSYARSAKARIGAGTLLRVPPGVTWALAVPPSKRVVLPTSSPIDEVSPSPDTSETSPAAD